MLKAKDEVISKLEVKGNEQLCLKATQFVAFDPTIMNVLVNKENIVVDVKKVKNYI